MIMTSQHLFSFSFVSISFLEHPPLWFKFFSCHSSHLRSKTPLIMSVYNNGLFLCRFLNILLLIPPLQISFSLHSPCQRCSLQILSWVACKEKKGGWQPVYVATCETRLCLAWKLLNIEYLFSHHFPIIISQLLISSIPFLHMIHICYIIWFKCLSHSSSSLKYSLGCCCINVLLKSLRSRMWSWLVPLDNTT